MHQSFGAYFFKQTYNLIDRVFTVFFPYTPSLFIFYITQYQPFIFFRSTFLSATPTSTHTLPLPKPSESIQLPIQFPVFQFPVVAVPSFQFLGSREKHVLWLDHRFRCKAGSSWSSCLERTQSSPNTCVRPANTVLVTRWSRQRKDLRTRS